MAPTNRHEEPDDPEANTSPRTWGETLKDLAAVRRDVVEDRVTFGRRCRQLEVMLADVAEIKNALSYFAEERPA